MHFADESGLLALIRLLLGWDESGRPHLLWILHNYMTTLLILHNYYIINHWCLSHQFINIYSPNRHNSIKSGNDKKN